MKIHLGKPGLVLLLSCIAVSAQAADSHYVPGLEGVKGSVLPPPGIYYKGYYVNYDADKTKNLPYESDVTVNAIAHRVAWVTSKKILGADLAFESVLPMMRTDLKINGQHLDKQTGVGDLYLGGILGWHTEKWDITAGTGYWAETGKYDQDKPASPGKDHDSMMLSFGTNTRLSETGDITFSALGRYEIPLKRDLNDELLIEWGLGKSYGLFNLGLVGYNTVEMGGGDTKRNAVGASVSYFSPKYKLGGDIAAYGEYANKSASEGRVIRASLTKIF